MGDHDSPNEPTLTSAEPVATAEIARLIVAGLAAFGVVQFDDAVLSTVTGIVGGLLSIALTVWARRKVTPTVRVGDSIPPGPPPGPPGPPPGPATP